MKENHGNFERELPSGYRQVLNLNAKNKKTGLIFTAASLVLTVLVLLPFLPAFRLGEIRQERFFADYLIFIGAMLGYIVLHELTHGAVYKLLTGEKLTFGLSWSCAFCGVPNVYTYRTTAFLALIAPFAVFTVLLLPLTILLYSVDMLLYGAFAFVFALHIGGCVGDLTLAWYFLFRFRDPRTLMRDSGPEQWIYVPEE